MLETLKVLNSEGVMPNEFAFLVSLESGVTFPKLDKIVDKQSLVDKQLIENVEKGFKITTKGMDLIVKAASSEKKSKKVYVNKSFKDNVIKYRELFPKGKLPSGKPARQNINSLTTSFKWFFDNFDYSWEEIFKATRMYLAEYHARNYEYMSTSQYFISKMNGSKVRYSILADYCDMIRDGVNTADDHFSEKVV